MSDVPDTDTETIPDKSDAITKIEKKRKKWDGFDCISVLRKAAKETGGRCE